MDACNRGDKPLYREREWKKQERRRKKKLKASWYRPADVVLFLPCTPDSELATRARKVVGTPMLRRLQYCSYGLLLY